MNTLTLEGQLEVVLTAEWEKRHELIISSDKAKELVRAMPAEELFWTIKATGIEDSGILLDMMTPEQLQFVFDLDFWQKDRLRPDKIAAWLLVMLELSRNAFESWMRWILAKDSWFFPAILNEFLTVVKRPDDMDIQEAKDILPAFTLDNVYYIDFKKQKLAPLFVSVITSILGAGDGFYRDVLETILWDTPSEILEMAYRFRCGRIGDFGIPDYYDALDIYTPLPLGSMHKIASGSLITRLPENLELPAFVPTLYISDCPVLESAIKGLAGRSVMERIVREATGVANKIIMADMTELDDPESLRNALKKTFCMLNLAIEYLCHQSGLSPEKVLATHFLEEMIRVCNNFLIPIGQRARTLCNDKGFWALPHDIKPILENASLRPPHIDTGDTVRTVMSMEEVNNLEKDLSLAEMWLRALYFLEPAFETWKDMTSWEKTNFLTYEEFSVDAALATMTANLLVDSKFKLAPLRRNDLPILLEIIQDIGDITGFLSEVLSPMFDAISPKDENKDEEKNIKRMIKEIAEGFDEMTRAKDAILSEPKFTKNILISVEK